MVQSSPPSVILLGATSLVGRYLVPRLLTQGMRVQAITRSSPPQCTIANLTWHRVEASLATVNPSLRLADVAIHLAPIWTLPQYLPELERLGVKRVLVFSSTSRFTKVNSSAPSEQQVVAKLSAAEAQVEGFCQAHDMDWTLFRPTLIYGDYVPDDLSLLGKGLETIVRFIRHTHCFPTVGGAKGLRQPVHADDLAQVCIAALGTPAAFNRAYNLSGAEVLSYRQVLVRIFTAMGRQPHLIPIPLAVLRLGIAMLRMLPRYRYLTLEMADRMNQDMVFSHTDATQDIGYQPRPFLG